MVAMIYGMSDTSQAMLHAFGIRTYVVSSLDMDLYRSSEKGENMESRDGILWSKLRVWQLEDYDKVVMLDTDLIVLKNCDELFLYPEFAASPMVSSTLTY
jgi:alpha-N-acetylglucosamine transferase